MTEVLACSTPKGPGTRWDGGGANAREGWFTTATPFAVTGRGSTLHLAPPEITPLARPRAGQRTSHGTSHGRSRKDRFGAPRPSSGVSWLIWRPTSDFCLHPSIQHV